MDRLYFIKSESHWHGSRACQQTNASCLWSHSFYGGKSMNEITDRLFSSKYLHTLGDIFVHSNHSIRIFRINCRRWDRRWLAQSWPAVEENFAEMRFLCFVFFVFLFSPSEEEAAFRKTKNANKFKRPKLLLHVTVCVSIAHNSLMSKTWPLEEGANRLFASCENEFSQFFVSVSSSVSSFDRN